MICISAQSCCKSGNCFVISPHLFSIMWWNFDHAHLLIAGIWLPLWFTSGSIKRKRCMARKQWTWTRAYRVCLRILNFVYLMLNVLVSMGRRNLQLPCDCQQYWCSLVTPPESCQERPLSTIISTRELPSWQNLQTMTVIVTLVSILSITSDSIFCTIL